MTPLKQWRTEMGLTLRQLEEKCDGRISRVTLNNLERGFYRPSLDQSRILCKVTRMSASKLFPEEVSV